RRTLVSTGLTEIASTLTSRSRAAGCGCDSSTSTRASGSVIDRDFLKATARMGHGSRLGCERLRWSPHFGPNRADGTAIPEPRSGTAHAPAHAPVPMGPCPTGQAGTAGLGRRVAVDRCRILTQIKDRL